MALGGWFLWARVQPGGVSGTLNGFVTHVRGDVADLSAGRDLKHAAEFYDDTYSHNGLYPQLTEEQSNAAGIGIDVVAVPCTSQAVVLQTLTVSRLLVAGTDRGEVSGRVGCAVDLDHPSPWTTK